MLRLLHSAFDAANAVDATAAGTKKDESFILLVIWRYCALRSEEMDQCAGGRMVCPGMDGGKEEEPSDRIALSIQRDRKVYRDRI